MDDETLAREYYRALDAGDYDRLAGLLAPTFVHRRPDRTIEGRDAFVEFVRVERPETDTSHEVDAVFGGAGGVAVHGRVRHADGSPWFAFVDAFEVADERIQRLRTYTREAE